MKLLLLAILLSGSSWATGFTAGISGNWNSAAIWGGAGVPGNHDTVTVKNGVTVTVSDSRIIGLSGKNGTTAIDLGNTGSIVIAAGGTLQVRGDIVYSAGVAATPAAPYLTVQAGGILEWDSSQAVPPHTTKYNAHPTADYAGRTFVAAGTSTSHAIVRSHAGGGHGYFGLGGHSVGGSYTATYTDFLRIGDAATPAFAKQWSGQLTNLTPWDFTHNTFTSCGMAPASTGNMSGPDVFRHDFNVHIASLGASVLALPGDAAGTTPLCAAVAAPQCPTTGKRELLGNVFDIAADSAFDARDFTIHSNYFGDRIAMANTASHTWWYFQNNFYRIAQPPAGNALTASGDVRDCIFVLDDPSTNTPHIVGFGAAGAETVTGNILDHTGDINASSGEFAVANVSLAPGATYTLRNNILLPNAAGHASTEITSIVQCCSNTGNKFIVDHNTYFGQRSPGLNQDAIHTGGGGPNPGGQLSSFRSNILWANSATSFYKLLALDNANTDVCAPAGCDYNDGWNTRSDGGSFTHAAQGYADNFSSAPGVHDLSVDPHFVDPARNTATFDSVYLGNKASLWSGDATYKSGDMVSSADSTVYRNAVINYRYVNGHGCSGANPKPGLYSADSRACWEWASLYRIRQAVAAQLLYDDQTTGAHGVDIITLLIQWIRTGFNPTNPSLAIAGHDGQDTGAVPVTFTPADAPESSLSGPPRRPGK